MGCCRVVPLLLLLLLSFTLFVLPTESRFHHLQSQDAVRKFFGSHGLLRSIPALNLQGKGSLLQKTTEVSTKVSKRVQQHLADPLSSAGLYYGVSPQSMERHAGSNRPKSQLAKKKGIRDTMSDTLDELRLMRLEMEALRKELHEMQQKVLGEGRYEQEEGLEEGNTAAALAKRRKRQREFDKLGLEIEKWAKQLIFEQDGEKDGWTEVKCNKMFQNTNRDGQTKTYLRWMKDSRGKHANPDDEREYPCIKMFSTIDAPIEEVCLYLSQQQNLNDYNDLLERHKDLEEITPYSKICWGQTPQILFIKPRDFVTFCSHRWLRDGTQVVVNQACKDDTGKIQEGRSMAYALRGANFISRDPDDPEKTRIFMLAHGNPGSDVPQWAVKTAVNSLAPIEPFKLFHKIHQGVLSCREELEQKSRRLDETEMVSSGGVSRRPAGLAQLGYACFWPQGGGIQEGGAAAVRSHSSTGSALPDLSEQSTISDEQPEQFAAPDTTDTLSEDRRATEDSIGRPFGSTAHDSESSSSSGPVQVEPSPSTLNSDSSPDDSVIVATLG